MDSVLFIVVLVVVALYWHNSMQSKTYAVQYARKECEKVGAQLSDQTVPRIRLSCSRDRNDQWRLWREYRLDYSIDGSHRL